MSYTPDHQGQASLALLKALINQLIKAKKITGDEARFIAQHAIDIVLGETGDKNDGAVKLLEKYVTQIPKI